MTVGSHVDGSDRNSMTVGSHLDGSDPSRRLGSFAKKSLHFVKLICKYNPHLDNFMETPSNFTNSIFSSHLSSTFMENTSSFEEMPKGLPILQDPTHFMKIDITQICLWKPPRTL
jgi:hypothetical protein